MIRKPARSKRKPARGFLRVTSRWGGLPPGRPIRLSCHREDSTWEERGITSSRPRGFGPFLCLLGCWLKGSELRTFHFELEAFKQEHLPHNPDDPVILHREDVINRRKMFKRLQDPALAQRFDEGLLGLLSRTRFTTVAVVIDKLLLREAYGDAAALLKVVAATFNRHLYQNRVEGYGKVLFPRPK